MKVQAIWEQKEIDTEAVRILAEALDVGEPVARLMVARGVDTPESGRDFLSAKLSAIPDPFLLAGMKKSVKRIEQAVKNNEKMVAWGDFDADGITSLSLIVLGFKSFGLKITPAAPKRLESGYGLNKESLKNLAEDGTKLVITLDNGIVSFEEVEYANELGMDVIIVDHHQLGEKLPEAHAVVNPLREDCNFPYDNLAAVGLTFMLVAGLRRHLVECGMLRKNEAPKLKEILDIVTIGTIADMVPLLGLNRIFVRYGLPLLSRTKRAGILALKESFKRDVDFEVDSFAVGFMIAPRLNASGRLQDAMAGVKLLTTESLEEARKQSDLLEKLNRARKQIETKVVDEVKEKFDADPQYAEAPILVFASKDWHEGVIGLVASRMVEHSGKPTIIISIGDDGNCRGSCRSIPALHIQQALVRHSKYFERYGGHSQAAGFSIEEKHIEDFRKDIIKDLSESLEPSDYIPRLITDGECALSNIDYQLLDQIEQMAPYGIANPSPVFTASNVEVVHARLVKNLHWKMGLKQAGKVERVLDAIAFRMSHLEINKGDILELAYIPEYNNFRGNRSLQVRVKDMRVVDDAR